MEYLNKNTCLGFIIFSALILIASPSWALECDFAIQKLDDDKHEFYASRVTKCAVNGQIINVSTRTLAYEYSNVNWSMVGRLHSAPIKLNVTDVSDISLYLERFSVKTAGRFLIDMACTKAKHLILKSNGYSDLCPYKKFGELSVSDAINFNIGRDPTIYRLSYIEAPLYFVGGEISINTLNSESDPLIASTLLFKSMSANRLMLSHLIILGDITIDNLQVADYLSLNGTIILGNLTITNSNINSLSLTKTIVAGQVNISNNNMVHTYISGARFDEFIQSANVWGKNSMVVEDDFKHISD